MADKKLHKSYTKKITSLKTIDSIGFLDKVITEWEKDFDSLIFDLDGTLWDTCEACAVAWNNVVNRNEIKFRRVTASDVRSVTGKPHAECIKTVFSSLSNEEISILIDETIIEDTLAIKRNGR